MKYLSTIIVLLLLGMSYGSNAFALVWATATSSPNLTTVNHPVNVTIALNNGGSSALTVSNVKLTATATLNPSSSRLAAAYSQFNQASNPSIAASVTTSISGGQVIFFSPSSGVTGSGSGTYTIGGQVFLSDGSIIAITTGARTLINPISLPAYERQ